MSGQLRVKAWEKFQHYHTRRPPWIRLHRRLLDDYDFAMLPVASRALAPMLWLLASETEDGTIPADLQQLAFRLRQSEDDVRLGLEPLIEDGFIIADGDASAMLATRKRNRCSETETETETETEKRERVAADAAPAPSTGSKARPTLEELKAYIQEKGYQVNAESWMAFYESKGWKIGKNPMKDWRAAVFTWHQRKVEDSRPRTNNYQEAKVDRPCAYCGGTWPCKTCFPEFGEASD